MARRITTGMLFLLITCMALGYASNQNSEEEEQRTAHQSVACINCHQLLADISTSVPVNHDVTVCRSCHDSGLTDQASWASIFHQDVNRLCSDCHVFHEPGVIKTQDGEFSLSDDAPSSFVCQTCHISGQPIELVSPGHRRAAADLYHSDDWSKAGDSPSQTCLNCHSEHGPNASDQPERAIGINLSASHSIGVDIRTLSSSKRSPRIDEKIRLFDNVIECQSCHTLSSGTKDALVDFDNPYDLCYGCHTIRG